MKVAVIGCGVIGGRRGEQVDGHELVGVFDLDFTRAQELAKKLGTKAYESLSTLLTKSGAEIAIVAVVNSELAPVSLECLKAGLHVLVEKPGAITLEQMSELEAAAKKYDRKVKVGFNHRFHPAILKARSLANEGAVGDLMYVKARYGHGARVGYEKEWRAVPAVGGGGELIDQGVHILDLIYWFMGDLKLVNSFVTTSFWDMPVDDNAVLNLRGENGWATFHVSCTEWKNSFQFEVYGKTGKIVVNGLGRSYGKETLTLYRMGPEMGPPTADVLEFDPVDRSWAMDLENLVAHIKTGAPMWGDLESARYALEQVQICYRENGYTSIPLALTGP